MLASALGRNGRHGALDNLQQGLLHTLTGHVTGDGEVLPTLASNLVDFVNVDDAALSLRHVTVGGIDEAQQDVFHVVTHVTGLGEGGCVDQSKGHIQLLRQGGGQVGFAAAGRAEHQNIGLAQLHLLPRRRRERAGGQHRVVQVVNTLVVVVHRHRQGALRGILTDDVVVEMGINLARGGQLFGGCGGRRDVCLQTLVGQDFFAELHTFIADGDIRPKHNLKYLCARLLAEGTPHAGVGRLGGQSNVCCHENPLSFVWSSLGAARGGAGRSSR